MDGGWRRERRVAILRREIIGSEKAGEQNDAGEGRQHDDRPHEFVPLRQSCQLHPNPRIGREKQCVRDEISGHQENRREHHRAHHHVNIFRENCIHQQGPDSGPAQHHFHQQRRAQHPGNRIPEKSDQRIGGNGQRVTKQDAAFGNPVSARGAHEGSFQHFDHGRTHVPDQRRQRREHQSEQRAEKDEPQGPSLCRRRSDPRIPRTSFRPSETIRCARPAAAARETRPGPAPSAAKKSTIPPARSLHFPRRAALQIPNGIASSHASSSDVPVKSRVLRARTAKSGATGVP